MPANQPIEERTVEAGRVGAEHAFGPNPGPLLTAVWRAPQRDWFGYVLALPALLLLGIVVLYPIVQGVILGFTNASTLTPGRSFIGLQNYQQILADPIFSTALVNSVVLTAVAVGLEVTLGMGLALLLCLKLPGIQIFRSVTMASWVVPIVATVMMYSVMTLPHYGLFNIILDHVGLQRWDSYWFGNLTLAMPTIIMMHVWRNAPFFAIALFAAMRTIPQDHYEAAAIDGASAFQRFLHITLPGVAYVAMIMVILHVLFTFNNFDFVYISTGGGPVNATMVLPVYVYRLFWQNYQTGLAASVGVVMMLILLVFTVVYVTRVREREA
jgi:multiple sugar transport system permease protein